MGDAEFDEPLQRSLIAVMRVEEQDGGIRCVHVYAFCPDVVLAVGEALGLPVKTLGYHFPFDVSAQPRR